MAGKRDYYEVLGTNKNATDDEIKKAYKKLANKWHPDKFASAPESEKKAAEEKMKDINEAYDVLKDSKKRAQYDQFGHVNPGGGYGGNPFDGGININDIFGGGGDIFGDLFGSFFGGSSRRSQQQYQYRQGPVKGNDLRYDLTINFEDAAFGKKFKIKVPRHETCKECNGTGAAKGTSSEICPECHGMGQKQTIRNVGPMRMQTLTTCDRCHGTGKVIKTPCSTCHGEGKIKVIKELEVTVPKGINEGQRILMRNGGEAGERGGQPGDLYVYIRIKPHEIFQRRGDDVYCEVPISFVQAALGAIVEAPTIDGKIDLKIEAGTQSGTVQTLRGKGIQHVKGEGRGDEYVTIKIVTPKNLSERQKALLRQFEGEIDDNKVHPEKKTFTDRLKDLFHFEIPKIFKRRAEIVDNL